MRQHIQRMQEIVEPENITTDAYIRTRVSYGGGMLDALRLRRKIIEHLPDAGGVPAQPGGCRNDCPLL
jgi:hypothetical protein